MSTSISYSAAFIIGLLGSVHCVGMCGGIMGALTYSVPVEYRKHGRFIALLILFNVGRIVSYSIAGAAFGLATWYFSGQSQYFSLILRHFAAIMLILLGLYLTGWWTVLRHLESAGAKLWSLLQPLIRRVFPVKQPHQALWLGFLWGWIPCGLVYSSLAWASTASNWQQSAGIMFFFGAGTIPALFVTGLLLDRLKQFLQSRDIRAFAGLLIILFGVWSLASIYLQSHTSHAHKPANQQKHQPIKTPDQHQ